jgi:ABC-type transport system involved in cytochrome bd biosynthesis fused ATPase/permease subunit
MDIVSSRMKLKCGKDLLQGYQIPNVLRTRVEFLEQYKEQQQKNCGIMKYPMTLKEMICGDEKTIFEEQIREFAKLIGLQSAFGENIDNKREYPLLSLGEQACVKILKSFFHGLSVGNEVFIFDEPTSSLDPRTNDDVMKFLAEQCETELAKNKFVVCITHQKEEATANIIVTKNRGDDVGVVSQRPMSRIIYPVLILPK